MYRPQHTLGFYFTHTYQREVYTMFNPNSFVERDLRKVKAVNEFASSREEYVINFEQFHTAIDENLNLKDLSTEVNNIDKISLEEMKSIMTLEDLRLHKIIGFSAEMILMFHNLNVTSLNLSALHATFYDIDFLKRVCGGVTNIYEYQSLFDQRPEFYDDVQGRAFYLENSHRFRILADASRWSNRPMSKESYTTLITTKLAEQLSTLGQFNMETRVEQARRELLDLRDYIEELDASGCLSDLKAIFKHSLQLNPELIRLFEPSKLHKSIDEISVDSLAAELILSIERRLRETRVQEDAKPEEDAWVNGYDQGYRAAMKDLLEKGIPNLTTEQKQHMSDVLGGSSYEVTESNDILDETSTGVTITLDDKIL